MNDALEQILSCLPYIACSIIIMGIIRWMKENNIKFQIVELSPNEYEIVTEGGQSVRANKQFLLG